LGNTKEGEDSNVSTPVEGSLAIDKQYQWAVASVTQAREGLPTVTDGVSGIVTEALKGALSERPLTAAELTTLAKQLVDKMTPQVPPKETTQG
jgi:hypothetical protein